MRIVGGRLRGRALCHQVLPKSQAIRPTADRLRESLFNILVHAYGDPVVDARVLDLFAGTGALGFEAMSRGAAFVLFVDDGAEARALLRGNVEALGAGGATKVYRRDATKLGPVSPLEPFSLAFLDPPYGKGLAEQALPRRATAAGLCRTRSRWSRRRPTRGSRRRRVSRSWSGASTTTRSSCFCARHSGCHARERGHPVPEVMSVITGSPAFTGDHSRLESADEQRVTA